MKAIGGTSASSSGAALLSGTMLDVPQVPISVTSILGYFQNLNNGRKEGFINAAVGT